MAGESGLRVGGDWYDCVEVDDHRVALVVGDVMGKGLHAAALMGQMRTTLRSLTVVDPSPSAVLTAMDRVTQDLAPDEIATVVYVLLDLSTGAARIARAGHLPPLLAAADGQHHGRLRRRVATAGSARTAGAARRDPRPLGSLLVLYSDGMVEDRETGLEPGLADLIRSVTSRQAAPARPGADRGHTARCGRANRGGTTTSPCCWRAEDGLQADGSSSDASGCYLAHLTRP